MQGMISWTSFIAVQGVFYRRYPGKKRRRNSQKREHPGSFNQNSFPTGFPGQVSRFASLEFTADDGNFHDGFLFFVPSATWNNHGEREPKVAQRKKIQPPCHGSAGGVDIETDLSHSPSPMRGGTMEAATLAPASFMYFRPSSLATSRETGIRTEGIINQNNAIMINSFRGSGDGRPSWGRQAAEQNS